MYSGKPISKMILNDSTSCVVPAHSELGWVRATQNAVEYWWMALEAKS